MHPLRLPFLLVLFTFPVFLTIGVAQTENTPPVADAGPSRYLGNDPLPLDASASFHPDGPYESLTYTWRQVSGPQLYTENLKTISPTISAVPIDPIDEPQTTLLTHQFQICEFELIVNDGTTDSIPSNVTITLVPNYQEQILELKNPPFDPRKPTIIAFSGGNGVTGGGMNLSGFPEWFAGANVFSNPYGPPYDGYADWMIATLSRLAPDYDQMIQTIGSSTGGQPAAEISRKLNGLYRDARYYVNHVSFLDSCCRYYPNDVSYLHLFQIPNEPFWIENHYATASPWLANTLNTRFPQHGTQRVWFRDSPNMDLWPTEDMFNDGVYAGYYASVAGPAANLQLSNTPAFYYFLWTEDVVGIRHYDETNYPGKLPEPISLRPIQTTTGTDGTTNSLLFSCEHSRNSTRYQLVFGASPNQMETVAAETTEAEPVFEVDSIPHEPTWWMIKAFDAHGSSIHSDPRAISQTAFGMPVRNATSFETYATVQDALDYSEPGDTITVQPGNYYENLVFPRHSLVLNSSEPTNPEIVAATIISSPTKWPAITFPSVNPLADESDQLFQHHLIGFTITGNGTGIYVEGGDPTLINNTVIGNKRHGIHVTEPINVILDGCTVAENLGDGIKGISGETASSRLQLSHCIVAGNRENGIIGGQVFGIHCTIAENGKSGVHCDLLQISNSILYHNSRDGLSANVSCPKATVHFSNVEGGGFGDSNIALPPLFAQSGADATDDGDTTTPRFDYHLQSTAGRRDPSSGQWVQDTSQSPSIDAGDPGAAANTEPKPNGNRLNQGVYGGTNQASLSL